MTHGKPLNYVCFMEDSEKKKRPFLFRRFFEPSNSLLRLNVFILPPCIQWSWMILKKHGDAFYLSSHVMFFQEKHTSAYARAKILHCFLVASPNSALYVIIRDYFPVMPKAKIDLSTRYIR